MNTKIPKTFDVLISRSDVEMNDEVLNAPHIIISFDKIMFVFHRKYKDSKNSGPCKEMTTAVFSIYNDKKVHEELLKEAKKMIEAYKVETHRDFLGKDVPFEKYKNTKLIKFVLSKL